MGPAKARVKEEQEYQAQQGPAQGLSARFAHMARTRPTGARIVANLEGQRAIYVITWVSQDAPARGVTNKCTHGAERERDIGSEGCDEWELNLLKDRRGGS